MSFFVITFKSTFVTILCFEKGEGGGGGKKKRKKEKLMIPGSHLEQSNMTGGGEARRNGSA